MVFEEAGGGPLDPAALKLQFALQMVAGGLQWPLGAVPLIERHLPELATVTDRFDPRIEDDEFAAHAAPHADRVPDALAGVRSARPDRLGDPPRETCQWKVTSFDELELGFDHCRVDDGGACRCLP